MYYIEEYCVVNKGRKKNTNCDNIYLNGFSLPEQNEGLDNYQLVKRKLSRKLVYGIFDGIDGLYDGAKASFLATSIFSKDNLNLAINDLNRQLLNTEPKTGTTINIVSLDRKKVTITQVGDSSVFVLTKGEFVQYIQEEHEDNLLSNYVGSKENIVIEENNFLLENNMRIIICSDGLVSEVPLKKIGNVLKNSTDAIQITNKLLNLALMYGGKDNISIITLVVKKKSFWPLFLIIIIAVIIMATLICLNVIAR